MDKPEGIESMYSIKFRINNKIEQNLLMSSTMVSVEEVIQNNHPNTDSDGSKDVNVR